MRLKDCQNFGDFRQLAKQRLPGPIFNYIDGAADDEVTYRRNTAAYEDVDLVPRVLNDVETVDMSVEVMGQKLDMPFYCAPTALQRLFHHDGERAVARAASQYGTMFGVSSLATVAVEEISKLAPGPKMFQFYFHKDRGLNDALLERARAAKFNVMALTVDTITGGNRERDLRTGFTSPPRLTPGSLFSFAAHPSWAWNFLTKEKFDMPHLSEHVSQGTNLAGLCRRIFFIPARPDDELERCRKTLRAMGRSIRLERHYECRGREARCRHRLHRDHGLQPWRPATRRGARAF